MVLIPSWNWGGYSGGRGGGWAASGFAGVARDGVYVGMTALGAALVFLTKEIKRWVLDAILGFAGGVMIVASYFSLLAPAIELSEAKGVSPWIPAVVGFCGRKSFLAGCRPDAATPAPWGFGRGGGRYKYHLAAKRLARLGHNAAQHPRGACGGRLAFGVVAAGLPNVPEASSLAAAVALAVGIDLQNFLEGTAVAMPLRRGGMAPSKNFFYGQLSAVVEPVAGGNRRRCRNPCSALVALRPGLRRGRHDLRRRRRACPPSLRKAATPTSPPWRLWSASQL